MALFLTESDVRQLATMPDAIAAVEAAVARQGRGQAINHPRRRLATPGRGLQLLPAADLGTGVIGFKAYTAGRGEVRFHVTLYDLETGEMTALLQATALGAIRTGAASGVATRYMAREDASTLGIIGTSTQARTQVRAIGAVRPIRQVLAYSRDPERRNAFSQWVKERLDIEAHAVEDPREVAQADVVVTATNARDPVLLGQWLTPGTHINAIGSNALTRRELDLDAVRRADRIIVDDRAQVPLESGDLLDALQRGILQLERLPELAEVVAGQIEGRRTAQEVTLFESHGVGLWDIALAEFVYRQAREQGIGTEVPV